MLVGEPDGSTPSCPTRFKEQSTPCSPTVLGKVELPELPELIAVAVAETPKLRHRFRRRPALVQLPDVTVMPIFARDAARQGFRNSSARPQGRRRSCCGAPLLLRPPRQTSANPRRRPRLDDLPHQPVTQTMAPAKGARMIAGRSSALALDIEIVLAAWAWREGGEFQ